MTPDPTRPPAEDPAPDVRAMLRRHGESVTPRGSYADVERRIVGSGSGRHRYRPHLTAAAVVLLVALVGGALVLAARDPDGNQLVTTSDRDATVAPEPEPEPDPDGDPGPTAPRPDPDPPGEVTTTEPSRTTTSEAPPDPSPDPSPDATAPADPPSSGDVGAAPITPQSRLRITGIGPVAVPMTVGEASRATGQDVRIDPTSRIDESNPCGFARIEGFDELWFMVDGDRIVRVDVGGSSPLRTEAGVGVGSSEAEVLGAYGSLVSTEAHPYAMDENSRYLVVTDPAHAGYEIIFSVHQGAVMDYRVGLADFVRYPEGCA